MWGSLLSRREMRWAGQPVPWGDVLSAFNRECQEWILIAVCLEPISDRLGGQITMCGAPDRLRSSTGWGVTALAQSSQEKEPDSRAGVSRGLPCLAIPFP
jgi:hypothetical protein